MATRQRAGASTKPTNSRRRTSKAADRPAPRGPLIPPHVARSLFGLLLLVVGAVTLVALLFPSSGALTRYVEDWLRPSFGQGAWLLALLLLVAGAVVERGSGVGRDWSVASVGALIVFMSGLGLLHLLSGGGQSPAALRQGGGTLGNWLSSGLTALLGVPASVVVLLGLIAAGLILLFSTTLRQLLQPAVSGGRFLATAVSTPARSIADERRTSRLAQDGDRSAVAVPVMAGGGRRNGGQPGDEDRPTLPDPLPSPAPISQTVVAADHRGATAVAIAPPQTSTGSLDVTIISTTERSWDLPTIGMLDLPKPPVPGRRLDHSRNIRIIEEKLRSFSIPATVSATNTGPVVTQYEVRPDAHIKLSRIEGLADDLAMALAARSIRIEAPIPGRDVVGIEIPNHDSEIVGFRQVIEETAIGDSASRLTFALGRDVAGKAYAVDLARMPHLLIAGATGSGKSVCVNALITSLLLRATPAELRLILVDLKRVELSAYQELPHLLVPVIVESPQARSVLSRVVNLMEQRYEVLAGARPPERNIAGYNLNAEKYGRRPMEYIVVVIDELADLMLKEGRKVEEPVVKLAQKARAVGIHLVLATQRPSVNVVTGLIKANVPSRIAFAMTSNVDSRTVLDQPGAEDLIGRGDMLYQPADLPRPIRLQGVFVSDAEVHAVTDFWRAQQPEPDYDDSLLEPDEFDDGEGGQFGWLARLSDDELTPRAAQLVMETGKASTSMMQTKLKVGFNRATRLMDELEKAGIVGPLDPRNPATPRVIYGSDNWLRGPADVDSPD
jgi:DNA segregation ATPase FtsK/SpoIIIE, S-DNA-T family